MQGFLETPYVEEISWCWILKENSGSYGTVAFDFKGYNIKEWKFDCNFPV